MVEGNPFLGTGGSAYDPAAHYTRATNHFDHSETLQVRIPPEIGAQLNAWGSRRIIGEYRCKQDVVRDLLFHGLHRLADQYGDYQFIEGLALEAARCHVDQLEAKQKEEQEFIESVERVLRNYEVNERPEALARYLTQLEMQATSFDQEVQTKVEAVVAQYTRRLGIKQ